MRRARPRASKPDHLRALETPLRLPEQQPQHPLLHGREQSIGQPSPGSGGWSSHFGNDHTHFRNDCHRHRRGHRHSPSRPEVSPADWTAQVRMSPRSRKPITGRDDLRPGAPSRPTRLPAGRFPSLSLSGGQWARLVDCDRECYPALRRREPAVGEERLSGAIRIDTEAPSACAHFTSVFTPRFFTRPDSSFAT